MENQTNAEPELPVELPVEVPPDSEQLIPNTQLQPKKVPVVLLVIASLFTLTLVGVIVAAVMNMGKKPQAKKIQQPQVTPTVVPSPTPGVSPTPMIVNIPQTSLPLILEVSAVGGGAMGERHEYTINLNMGPSDTLNVIKVDENEITGFPGYSKGATDKGLRIGHGKAFLDIIPVFEGAGFPLLKKVKNTVITNNDVSAQKIYRLGLSDMESNFVLSENTGYVYTTQYSEDQETCSSTFEPGSGKTFPACIGGGLHVETNSSGPVTISCSGDATDAAWCDSIVKSLSITGN